MRIFELIIETSLIWKLWYAINAIAYVALIFVPKSRFTHFLFDRGYVLVLPVIHLVGLATGGTIARLFCGFPFFEHLASTGGDFGHLQIAAAFAITATTADLVFASVILRKYDDLNLIWKLIIAFWVLFVGWLLGICIYLALRRIMGPRERRVRIGCIEIG